VAQENAASQAVERVETAWGFAITRMNLLTLERGGAFEVDERQRRQLLVVRDWDALGSGEPIGELEVVAVVGSEGSLHTPRGRAACGPQSDRRNRARRGRVMGFMRCPL
jgi:hypothetical protein